MDLGSGVGWGFLRNSQNKSLQLIQSLKHQARAARFFSKASSPPPIVFFIYLFIAKHQAPRLAAFILKHQALPPVVFFYLGGPAQRQAPTKKA